jgi:hypothetical protein
VLTRTSGISQVVAFRLSQRWIFVSTMKPEGSICNRVYKMPLKKQQRTAGDSSVGKPHAPAIPVSKNM